MHIGNKMPNFGNTAIDGHIEETRNIHVETVDGWIRARNKSAEAASVHVLIINHGTALVNKSTSVSARYARLCMPRWHETIFPTFVC